MNDHRSYIHNLSSTVVKFINPEKNNCDDSHVFVSFSTVQIYDAPYIHLYSSPSTGILRTHKMTRWLNSSVGRALHWYYRGYGFKSSSSLNFFKALTSQLLKLCI